jgi:hypothetical protein
MAKKALVSMKALEAKFSADVANVTARINQPQGNTIGIRNSKFTYKQEVIGRTMVAIAVDFVHAQTWYDEAFDPDNPSPPACHALSVDGEAMQPFSESPNKQNDYCDGCPLDAWGSADVGRGKACSQQYKIALIAAGPGETLATCEMAIITAPPTSIKNWDNYVKQIAKEAKRPPYAVFTRFAFDENAEHPVLTFELERLVDNVEDASAIMERLDEARKLLMTPPDFSQRSAPKKKVSKKKAKKKVATKKKVSNKKAASKKKTTTRKRGASKFS